MSKVVRIHASRQPNRPHYIEAWAKKRGLTQAALARETGIDKSLINRWYKGASPMTDNQEKLAAFFDIEPEQLFREPDDNWLNRKLKSHKPLVDFIARSTEKELDRLESLVEISFPKDGTHG